MDTEKIAQFQRNALQRIGQLEQVVQDISRLLAWLVGEKEDRYYIGRETRIAELVGAIAAEIGIPEHKSKGICIAALLLDIGKLSVPAEICGKPDLFSEIEFKLIQTHSQEGYAMLRHIPFPWPVAETVRQHHERLDGSGYPQGLAGKAILPSARILAVADVVEAMLSPRPHRPPCTVGEVMKEIRDNRGILYDPTVVDACLRLFREKNFTFAKQIKTTDQHDPTSPRELDGYLP